VLQCVAVCCGVVWCVVVSRRALSHEQSSINSSRFLASVLQCVEWCCNVLQCVAVCCSVYCRMLQASINSLRVLAFACDKGRGPGREWGGLEKKTV